MADMSDETPNANESRTSADVVEQNDDCASLTQRAKDVFFSDPVKLEVEKWENYLENMTNYLKGLDTINSLEKLSNAVTIEIPCLVQKIFIMTRKIWQKIAAEKLAGFQNSCFDENVYYKFQEQENACWCAIGILLYRAVIYDVFYSVLYPDGVLRNYLQYRKELRDFFHIFDEPAPIPFSKESAIATGELVRKFTNVRGNFKECFVILGVRKENSRIEYVIVHLLDKFPQAPISAYQKLGPGVVVIPPPSLANVETTFYLKSLSEYSSSRMEKSAIMMRGVVAIATHWNKTI